MFRRPFQHDAETGRQRGGNLLFQVYRNETGPQDSDVLRGPRRHVIAHLWRLCYPPLRLANVH